MGRLIVVNGTSSAGKTTFCEALQDALPDPYLLTSYDIFWASMPARYFPWETHEEDGVRYVTAEQAGRPSTTLELGPVGQRTVSGAHHAVAALLASGVNVIADVLFLHPDWFAEARRLWTPFAPLWIALKPPLTVSEEWEARREATLAGRPTGLARGLFAAVHAHSPPDLTLDPSRCHPDELARSVAAWVGRGCPHPFDGMGAFNR
ncbi:AAA family ATPase [Deinococcus sp. SDU3-2]|uniref:AAA family ATPase n=1 Tax=Deinococcus terrestris TaxID=2651870 RepID=A0A7X1NU40_9DEIO|nr:AAA family ATPase [Deinococcus terrestris]MPY65843.1 AAA family ATPase [Deinococcus terrestris]